MTAPDKIETLWLQFGPMGDIESVSDEPMVAHVAWVKLSDHQAAVAAAYEAAAQVCDHLCRQAKAQGRGDFIAHGIGAMNIRALAPPDQIAALAAERATTVTVKPLVWKELEQDRGDGTTDLTGDHEAVSCVGAYSIALSFGSDSYYWSVALNADEIGHSFDDLGYAKAAAQADHDARIRSAITITSGPNPSTLPLAEVKALMECGMYLAWAQANEHMKVEFCYEAWDAMRKALTALQERMK